jgi:hypothetical protein
MKINLDCLTPIGLAALQYALDDSFTMAGGPELAELERLAKEVHAYGVSLCGADEYGITAALVYAALDEQQIYTAGLSKAA